MSLAGLHVLITGAAGGLGTAVTERLRAEGAVLHLPAIEELDLRDESAVSRYFDAVPPLWASVHLAGGFAMKPIAETTADDWRKMHDLNGLTCFLSCREAIKSMRRRTPASGGRIVNVAARPAVSPVAGMLAYGTSKAVVASITASIAEEVRSEGILVNAIVPSIIDTPANRASMPNADHTKWPRAAELAETIAWLVSPSQSLTTGTLIPVYGRA